MTKYSEFIKELDPNLFGLQPEVWDKIGESLAEHVVGLNESIDTANGQLKTVQSQLEEATKARDSLNEQIKMLQETATQEAKKKDGAIGIAEKQNTLLETALQQAQASKERFDKLAQQLQAKIDASESDKAKISQEAEIKQQTLIKENDALKNSVKTLTEEVTKTLSQKAIVEGDVVALKQELQSAQMKISGMEAETKAAIDALNSQINVQREQYQATFDKINQITEGEGFIPANGIKKYLLGKELIPPSVTTFTPDGETKLVVGAITYGADQIKEIANMALQSMVAHGVNVDNPVAIGDFLSGWLTENENLKKQIAEKETIIEGLNENTVLTLNEEAENKLLDMLDGFFQAHAAEAISEALPEKMMENAAKIAIYEKIVENIKRTVRMGDINISEGYEEAEALRKQLEDAKTSEADAKREMFKAQAEAIVESRIAQLPPDKSKFVRMRVKSPATPGEAETMITEALNAYERERAEMSRSNLKQLSKAPGAVVQIDETTISPAQTQDENDIMNGYVKAVRHIGK